MEAVIKAVLYDEYAGRAGAYRFDPATGERTTLTGVLRPDDHADLPVPVQGAEGIDHEHGLDEPPDTGANAK